MLVAISAVHELGHEAVSYTHLDVYKRQDFICAAEFATTENINFMAMHGKGLICMPMSQEYVKKAKDI